jgi:predicted ATPase
MEKRYREHLTWWEAEINRIAGEIAHRSPRTDALDAEKQFERALAVARQQQAKSRELRAAMSLARLSRDQGKVEQAHARSRKVESRRSAFCGMPAMLKKRQYSSRRFRRDCGLLAMLKVVVLH